jgi:5-methyltetrahydrofolate--homocysteine methyltransferase
MNNLVDLMNSIIEGHVSRATEITGKALNQGITAKELLDNGLLPAMEQVGIAFESCEIYLPELLMTGEAMKASIELLRPELAQTDTSYAGKCAIGTVQGDLHDIGKNIVILMLQGNGWDVTDLGIDVSPKQFCDTIKHNDFDILCLSALLTFTMPMMVDTINAIKENGLRSKVKIMVGGAPVNQSFADQIGADAYAKDAVEAMKIAKSLITR